MNLESAELQPVLKLDVLDFGDFILDSDEGFVGEKVEVELFDFFGGEFLFEGGGEGGDDTLEPGGHVGDEGYPYGGTSETGELMTCFSFVNMIGKRISSNSTGQIIRCDLGHRLTLPRWRL